MAAEEVSLDDQEPEYEDEPVPPEMRTPRASRG
jgi:hypothetical protein